MAIITNTAFQPSAFQKTGFQIAAEVFAGTGGVIPAWMLALLMARRKRVPILDPTPVVPEPVITRPRLRAVPPALAVPPRISLAPLRAAQMREAARLLMQAAAELDALIEASDWEDAA